VVPAAFTSSHFEQALTAPDSFGAIVNSIKYASAAMVLDLVLGVLIGYLIVRTTVRGAGVLDALCMLPLAVPGLVLAFGYVAMSQRWPMGKGGPLGDMILGAEPNPIPLLVMAYAVRRLPYIVRSTVAGLEQTSGELEEAAVNLGSVAIHGGAARDCALDHGEPDRGRLACVQFLDAGGERQLDPGAAIQELPDHAGDLFIHGAAGGWAAHRERDGCVGDGVAHGDAGGGRRRFWGRSWGRYLGCEGRRREIANRQIAKPIAKSPNRGIVKVREVARSAERKSARRDGACFASVAGSAIWRLGDLATWRSCTSPLGGEDFEVEDEH
jgi:hypothetical protein